MLETVMSVVAANGWFDFQSPFERSIYTSRGASLWMVLTRSGRPDTFVKFSDLVDLEQESTRCFEAARGFPDQAPEFVGFARQGTVHVLVTRALDFEAVTADKLRRQPVLDVVRSGLVQYFRQSQSLSVDPGSHQNRPWLEALGSYYSDHALSSVAQPALSRLGHWMHRLRGTPQHGDLVANNLGVRKDSTLAIFDWEDFGAVWLPGLDLFTLEFSLEQEAEWAKQRGRTVASPKDLDPAALMNALGLSSDTWQQLQLPCALAFRYLKRNYGPEIQAKLDAVILKMA